MRHQLLGPKSRQTPRPGRWGPDQFNQNGSPPAPAARSGPRAPKQSRPGGENVEPRWRRGPGGVGSGRKPRGGFSWRQPPSRSPVLPAGTVPTAARRAAPTSQATPAEPGPEPRWRRLNSRAETSHTSEGVRGAEEETSGRAPPCSTCREGRGERGALPVSPRG